MSEYLDEKSKGLSTIYAFENSAKIIKNGVQTLIHFWILT